MDSLYKKTLEMIILYINFGQEAQKLDFQDADGGHFGFMQITRVTQSCQFGNQAEFAQIPLGTTNQEKNFIVPTIARLMYGAYGGVNWIISTY